MQRDLSKTVSAAGKVVTLTDAQNPATVTEVVALLSGNTLTSDDVESDFDFDDVNEPANLVAVLQRQ